MRKLFEKLPEILKPSEIAEIFRDKEETIIDMFEQGKLRGFQVGSQWRATKENIEKYIEGDDHQNALMEYKIKIGKLVRGRMGDCISLLSQEEIEKLTTLEYSKEVFGISYPLLKRLPTEKAEQNNFEAVNYWKKVFGGKYLVTNRWNERHREKFVKWFFGHFD